jgi:hypothetical protein
LHIWLLLVVVEAATVATVAPVVVLAVTELTPASATLL